MKLPALVAAALFCGCGGRLEPDAAAVGLGGLADPSADASGDAESGHSPEWEDDAPSTDAIDVSVHTEVPAPSPFSTCDSYVVKERATRVADEVRGVLATGELLFTAGTYNPTLDAFAPATPIRSSGLFASLLTDGRVLLVGGQHGGMWTRSSDPEAARWDPATRALVKTSPMHHGRNRTSAARLDDGRLLVMGGEEGSWDKRSYGPLAPPEIYDPARDVWTDTASRPLVSRDYAALARLPDGRVLVIGGLARPTGSIPLTDPLPAPTSAVEIYDPAADSFRLTTPMRDPRRAPVATVAPDGSVLVFGGTRGERFDPMTETWTVTSPAWLGGETHVAQFWSPGFMTAWLPCGGVLLGSSATSTELWMYWPARDRWLRWPYSGGNVANVFSIDSGALVVTEGTGGLLTTLEP